MPRTAYSKQYKGEFDVEQLLAKKSNSAPAEVHSVSPELRAWIHEDVVCPSCAVGGATIVMPAKSKRDGRVVSQAHFRFGGASGPHHPMCEFVDETNGESTEHLVDFRNERTDLTRAVRELVCRALQLKAFSQEDMHAMRLWFLETKKAGAFQSTVDDAALDWCASLAEHRQYEGLVFQPQFGDLEGFNWKEAARERFAQLNRALVEQSTAAFWSFNGEGLVRTRSLAKRLRGQTAFDIRPLTGKYRQSFDLVAFACRYLPKGKKRWQYFNTVPASEVSFVIALCALLLFVSDWNLDAAAALFVRLACAPPASEQDAGNIIGMNPFHDYLAWQGIVAAQEIVARSANGLDAAAQLAAIEAELRDLHRRSGRT